MNKSVLPSTGWLVFTIQKVGPRWQIEFWIIFLNVNGTWIATSQPRWVFLYAVHLHRENYFPLREPLAFWFPELWLWKVSLNVLTKDRQTERQIDTWKRERESDLKQVTLSGFSHFGNLKNKLNKPLLWHTSSRADCVSANSSTWDKLFIFWRQNFSCQLHWLPGWALPLCKCDACTKAD